MCSICTRRCDLWSNDRLKSFVASCRRCRVEREDGDAHYFILCGLMELVLRKVGEVNCGSAPKRSPLAAIVKRAYGP